jgi:hypothetical protein
MKWRSKWFLFTSILLTVNTAICCHLKQQELLRAQLRQLRSLFRVVLCYGSSRLPCWVVMPWIRQHIALVWCSVDHTLLHVTITGPTGRTVYFLFTAINSLYMCPALFAHHQEVRYVQQLVYFLAYCVGWLLAGLEWSSTPTALYKWIQKNRWTQQKMIY